MSAVDIWINGQPHALGDGATVVDALAALGAPEKGVAVAVDGAVVPRGRWAGTTLAAGAQIEVLTAVQGG
ncbi:MAG: sulfur carrier protein [Pseudonocardiales bacterium]|jgi:sulfur carrier protein|nr:sulfur carrier protein [Pseudonocardiales bacterium]